jgi:toxin CcdB
MAQFDVHRNGGRNRAAIPYMVVVQTSRLDALPTRLVIPLVLPNPSYRREPRLAPSLMVGGRELVLHAWEMQAVPVSALGPVVASLADDHSAAQIIGAIDEVISRVWC